MATLTQGQIQAVAVAAGLPNAALMAAIAMAESSGRTDIVNSIGCVGLWQINQPVHISSHRTWTVAWLKNPLNNATAAKSLLNVQGLSAWQAYTNGAYLKYYKGTVPATPNAPQGASDIIMAPINIVTSAADSALGAATGINRVAQVLSSAGNWISQASNWVRIGYVIGGIVLAVVGLATIADKPVLDTGKALINSGVVKKVIKK